MTDIVERLRFTQANGLFDAVRCGKAVSFAEAADTIEQLRARIAELEIDVAIQDCLATSQYNAGVGVGWNLGVRDDPAGLIRAREGTEHLAELKRLKAARAAIRQRTGQ